MLLLGTRVGGGTGPLGGVGRSLVKQVSYKIMALNLFDIAKGATSSILYLGG